MPTGYTAGVQDGTIVELEDFVIQCARAMGACIMQRDEPSCLPPILEEPSKHYDEQMKNYLDEWKRLHSIEDVEKEFKEYRTKKFFEYSDAIDDRRRDRAKYNAMLSKVYNWIPPTDDHVNFKEWMISQLEDSIDFDCSEDYYAKALKELNELTPKQWLKDSIESVESSLAYYEKAKREETERVFSRNQWKIKLFESFRKQLK